MRPTVLLFALALGACGGTSSETPWPVEPDDRPLGASEPVAPVPEPEPAKEPAEPGADAGTQKRRAGEP